MTSTAFSDYAVWTQLTTSGFKQQVFIMYHGTSVDNAVEILDDGGFE